MKAILFGLSVVFISITADASDQANSTILKSPEEKQVKYFVSPAIGTQYGEGIFYLIKDGSVWKASKAGDLSQDGVERISVNLAAREIRLFASAPSKVSTLEQQRGPGRDNKWECYKGLGGNGYRNNSDYSICSSSLTKGVTNPGEAIIGSLNLLLGSARRMMAVDQEAVIAAAETSGLLGMAEQEREVSRLKEYRNAFEQAKSSYALKNFIEKYRNIDPDGLTTKAQQALPEVEAMEKEKWLVEYRKDYESASTSADYQKFISKYRSNDPDLLIPIAENKYRTLSNKEAHQKEAELIAMRRELKSKEIGDSVCNLLKNTVDRIVVAEGRNGPIYGGEEKGSTLLRGFVEGISPNKKRVQIRLAAIRFSGLYGGKHEKDSSFTDYNGANIKTGDVIWDSTYDWKPCN